MAGGKGTRLANINPNLPKPMIPIAGKPVLEWQISNLRQQGINNITIAIGYLGHVVKNFFGDSVNYIEETTPLGTAGALYFLNKKIKEDFLLINGDVIFDVDMNRFYQAHLKQKGVITIFTHPNDHPYDSGVIVTDDCNRVTKWYTKDEERGFYKNRTNAGLHLVSPIVLKQFKKPSPVDLDRDILKPMALKKSLFVYDSPEYVKDMGTPQRHKQVEQDILNGRVMAKNLANKQKCVFIDRDGTINKHVGFLYKIEDFELLPGVAKIIKNINKSGYLAIIVTNQPVIARGEVAWEGLIEIHNKMETLLGEQGAYVDDIYVCPHHPNKGFAGEVIAYKTVCECRKPKPGMLLDAAKKYNIDLSRSYMVGDSISDEEAGRQAGCAGYFNSLDAFKKMLN